MERDHIRLRARQDIAEALAIGAPPPAPTPPPGAPPGAPPGMGAPQVGPLPPALMPHPPMGALSMGGPPMGPGGMPQVPPAVSPLQMMPSMHSPPMAAVLQGAEGMKGHPMMTQPTGFARGGLVVRR